MEFIVLIIYCFYFIFVGILIYGNYKIKPFHKNEKQVFEVKICVIIPVRNEAKNIINLLQSFENQVFNKDCFEVFVMDDFSTDETFELVKQFSEKSKLQIKLLQLHQKNTISPKKTAITQAINLTNAELIITTDGDCRIEQNYIKTIHDFYISENKPKFISAPVCFFEPKSFLEKILFVEFSSLIATGSALINLGQASMCNGANLAFQKSAFLEVGGYIGFDQIPSGDDEFLLKKIAKIYPEKISFLKNENAIIRTQSPENLKELYFQRKRWASKWKLHEGFSVKIMALFIFGFHLVNILSGIGILFQFFDKPYLILACFFLKLMAELFFIFPMLNLFGMKKLTKYIILLQFLYSFYAVFFGIVANLGGYEWKGRVFK